MLNSHTLVIALLKPSFDSGDLHLRKVAHVEGTHCHRKKFRSGEHNPRKDEPHNICPRGIGSRLEMLSGLHTDLTKPLCESNDQRITEDPEISPPDTEL